MHGEAQKDLTSCEDYNNNKLSIQTVRAVVPKFKGMRSASSEENTSVLQASARRSHFIKPDFFKLVPKTSATGLTGGEGERRLHAMDELCESKAFEEPIRVGGQCSTERASKNPFRYKVSQPVIIICKINSQVESQHQTKEDKLKIERARTEASSGGLASREERSFKLRKVYCPQNSMERQREATSSQNSQGYISLITLKATEAGEGNADSSTRSKLKANFSALNDSKLSWKMAPVFNKLELKEVMARPVHRPSIPASPALVHHRSEATQAPRASEIESRKELISPPVPASQLAPTSTSIRPASATSHTASDRKIPKPALKKKLQTPPLVSPASLATVTNLATKRSIFSPPEYSAKKVTFNTKCRVFTFSSTPSSNLASN